MQQNKEWQAELKILREIISKASLEKSIKWGAEVYTYNGNNVVSYGGFKNYFALWFFNGVFLKDKSKVLVNAQENKTKSLRRWRFTSAKEIDEKKILAYINEAIDVEKKGLKIKPEKFKAVAVPEMLAQAIKDDVQLKTSFSKLTPGRQKEYILYLNEAKQEATQKARLVKIKPMILQGQGLNDKYR